MSAPNVTRWMGIGLLGLPLYGALSFFSSLDPQPDPNTHYGAWARFVTTDSFPLTHLFFSAPSPTPQPDPNTHYGAWARFVTTDSFLLTHLFFSDLGLILAIFGTFALGAYLATSRAGRMGGVATAIARSEE